MAPRHMTRLISELDRILRSRSEIFGQPAIQDGLEGDLERCEIYEISRPRDRVGAFVHKVNLTCTGASVKGVFAIDPANVHPLISAYWHLYHGSEAPFILSKDKILVETFPQEVHMQHVLGASEVHNGLYYRVMETRAYHDRDLVAKGVACVPKHLIPIQWFREYVVRTAISRHKSWYSLADFENEPLTLSLPDGMVGSPHVRCIMTTQSGIRELSAQVPLWDVVLGGTHLGLKLVDRHGSTFFFEGLQPDGTNEGLFIRVFDMIDANGEWLPNAPLANVVDLVLEVDGRNDPHWKARMYGGDVHEEDIPQG